MGKSVSSGINDTYFDGVYKNIWKALIPQKLTDAETTYIIKQLDFNNTPRVLDLMCGYGRHAIALATKGCKVTAVDNLPDYINELHAITQQEKLDIVPVLQPVLEFRSRDSFDLGICMGNSFNFFDREHSLQLLKATHDHLSEAGLLWINSWSIAEIAIKHFVPEHTGKSGDITVVTKSEFLFQPARIETVNIFRDADGQEEIKKAIDYVFSLNEIEQMLHEAGFDLIATESIPGKKNFVLGDPRVYILAKKKRPEMSL